MKILVACEYSGRVRQAFRDRGHDAYSVDLFEDAEDGSLYHYKADALSMVYDMGYEWDLLIAHPPCTDLAVSGARHFAAKRADGRQQRALEFVKALMDAPVPMICIENPISIISTAIRKPDQIIQPWMFGHGETKATCLWLKGLPKLTPTDIVEGREARVHRMAPSPTRWKDRSRTYQGIADAMAAQWGGNSIQVFV